ncbi:hypothetical protein EV421DRAFT_1935593 [Armillaria borealis]|uniref:Uncharacterized protein n=1 Tax=Armillaria borealis TaxID=47425 RepID=A0AA39ITV5_9AGAR|nr:hypothetical protein EV421DRAFT_1935593 [Armillaria borealis]
MPAAIIHSPSHNVRDEVVNVIHLCAHNHEKLSQLGQSFINYFIRAYVADLDTSSLHKSFVNELLSFHPLLWRLQVISYHRPTRLRRVSRRGIPRWLWSRDRYWTPFLFFCILWCSTYDDTLSTDYYELLKDGIIVEWPQMPVTTNNYTSPLVSMLIMALVSAPDNVTHETHGKLSIGFYVGLYLTHALSSSSPVHGQSKIMYENPSRGAKAFYLSRLSRLQISV